MIIKLANVAKSKLIKRYKAEWMNALSEYRDNQTGKLRTYSLFKYRLCRESYFKYIKDISVRRIFTKLRVSCHKLEIELGRYIKKKYKQMQDYALYVNWKLKTKSIL